MAALFYFSHFVLDSDDFVGIVSINVVQQISCTDITIIDDDVFENYEEEFSVHITTSERNVNISMPYAVVVIIDDESKSHC